MSATTSLAEAARRDLGGLEDSIVGPGDPGYDEARAVHNLEHGYVWVYYQPAGADALSAPVVDALRSAATGQRKVLLAPYPQLPAGAALDFAAWDELQQCGRGVTAGEAIATLGAFVTAYREGPLAPEPGAA